MSDYPSELDLKSIETWSFKTPHAFEQFMGFVRSCGTYWPEGSFGWKQRGRRYWISTGGWSGNESILQAMAANGIFWSVCWASHRKGGHYVFHLPNPKTYFKTQRKCHE